MINNNSYVNIRKNGVNIYHNGITPLNNVINNLNKKITYRLGKVSNAKRKLANLSVNQKKEIKALKAEIQLHSRAADQFYKQQISAIKRSNKQFHNHLPISQTELKNLKKLLIPRQ